MKKLLQRFCSDRGNTAASMIFAIIAMVLVGATVSVTITLTSLSSTVTRTSWMTTAADLRYDQYVRELRAGGTPVTTPTCYPTENSCVSVIGATTSGNTITLTLHTVYAIGVATTDFKRTCTTNAGSLITGFDSGNNPVWGN